MWQPRTFTRLFQSGQAFAFLPVSHAAASKPCCVMPCCAVLCVVVFFVAGKAAGGAGRVGCTCSQKASKATEEKGVCVGVHSVLLMCQTLFQAQGAQMEARGHGCMQQLCVCKGKVCYAAQCFLPLLSAASVNGGQILLTCVLLRCVVVDCTCATQAKKKQKGAAGGGADGANSDSSGSDAEGDGAAAAAAAGGSKPPVPKQQDLD